MIESYDFGKIIIDGKKYNSDLIIFPDRIEPNWWRKKGHELNVEDIRDVIDAKPKTLVVGTGFSGLMRVMPETEKHLGSKNIKVIAEDSKKACQTYNRLDKTQKVIGAFHLTC